MLDDADAAYLAVKARDARFDGRLFVGVTSTGVYCRPVCRVRTPRRENCRFFASAAQAEAAAFRPCLKCRPEIAPGLSQMDSSRVLADAAAQIIGVSLQAGEPLDGPALARRLGVTDRHLRRIFHATHGVTPHEYLDTQRLLLAKQLLTDTRLAVTQVALASGFTSLRRFNAVFAGRYRLRPTQLRHGAVPARDAGEPIVLRLAYRPPYDVEAMLGFLARRQLAGVEQVDGLHWRRSLRCRHGGRDHAGWVQVGFVPQRNEVEVAVGNGLASALAAVRQAVRVALDLDADPARVDPVLARLPLPPCPGLRLPGAADGFETAVRIVLGQQVTVAAACTLAGRLVQRFGEPMASPFPGVDQLFPTPRALAAADAAELQALGLVRQRVQALQALAAAVAEGRLELHRGAPLQPTLQALLALPGVGDWTAQLIALRALAWPDAWPARDLGVLKALGTRDPTQATALAEAWRPWRGYAVMRLWHHLETSR